MDQDQYPYVIITVIQQKRFNVLSAERLESRLCEQIKSQHGLQSLIYYIQYINKPPLNI